MYSPFNDIKIPVAGTAKIDINDSNLKFGNIITTALPYIFGIVGIILLLNIITSGLRMMTSRGEPKTLQAAQAKLATSLIGILILFASFWVVQIIMKFIGINTLLFS